MILLVFILFLLLAAFYHLLSQSSSKNLPATRASPSALQRLLAEAFEHLPPIPRPRVLILYGTEYGFAKEVAHKLAAALAARDLAPRVLSTLHYRPVQLHRERFCALVCSTTGDGAVPNEAADLRDAIAAAQWPVPPHLRLAVLALGDRAYPHFCSGGKLFDKVLGGKRLLPRVDVDQEDWAVIDAWIENFEQAVSAELGGNAEEVEEVDYLESALETYASELHNTTEARYTRNEPFMATLVEARMLTAQRTGHADDKEVVRVEFDIGGSGIRYEVGDAVGVVPENNTEHVTKLLLGMASNGDEMVRVTEKGEELTFEEALSTKLDICNVKPELVAALATRVKDKGARALAERVLGNDVRDLVAGRGVSVSEWGKNYLTQRDVSDVLTDFVDATLSPQDLVDALRPLHARYYSISSTPHVDAGRIAATVDVLRYKRLGIEREGVASTFLKDRCKVNESKVGIFISKNPNFRLPKDSTRPIVMIGPGTGVAPFIAFVQERVARKAKGANWLLFGCRHEAQDFLYKEELKAYVGSGDLCLKTAFSRDGDSKVYVQHRMTEFAKELWELIDSDRGHVYVCGDGGKMEEDVDAELVRIVATEGDMSGEAARTYVDALSESHRYQKDVWVS